MHFSFVITDVLQPTAAAVHIFVTETPHCLLGSCVVICTTGPRLFRGTDNAEQLVLPFETL